MTLYLIILLAVGFGTFLYAINKVKKIIINLEGKLSKSSGKDREIYSEYIKKYKSTIVVLRYCIIAIVVIILGALFAFKKIFE